MKLKRMIFFLPVILMLSLTLYACENSTTIEGESAEYTNADETFSVSFLPQKKTSGISTKILRQTSSILPIKTTL